MNITISERFKKSAKPLLKKYPSFVSDLENLKENLLENPTLGVHLGNDCYKIRMAISSKGRGKSGGARVITCVQVTEDTIYLLTIYDKSDRESLEDNELKDLLEDAGIFREE
jgi:mRNA-degrading endonuclease RelE of RelBE toxin-antitoxin system